MKKLGIVLMVIGVMMVGWYGYQYWSGMQSVERIDDSVVKGLDNKDNEDFSTIDKDPNTVEKISISDNTNSHDTEQSSTNDQSANVDYTNGEGIAKLVIPAIDLAFDVFSGTDDEALAKGVGMYDSQSTTTPDGFKHTVLSGHRDSVFRPVGDLQEGDSLYVNYKGEDYEYQINKIWITDADDHSVIVEKEEATLTLSTCYPFQFIGSAPDRYIVQAKLVKKGDLLNLN